MPEDPYRLILDTNVVLRGILNMQSASGQILDACQNRRMIAVLSRAILGEYRFVLSHPEVVLRYPQITQQKIDESLHRLRYVADVLRQVTAQFDFPRDPKDAMLIEAAIDGNATHIVTCDRDLLSLPEDHADTGKRFRQRLPQLRILDPYDFVSQHGKEMKPE